VKPKGLSTVTHPGGPENVSPKVGGRLTSVFRRRSLENGAVKGLWNPGTQEREKGSKGGTKERLISLQRSEMADAVKGVVGV